MKKYLLSLCLLCTGLLAAGFAHAAAQGSRAAGAEPLVLVLPFQINADESMKRLQDELPQMVSRNLASKGLRVLPLARGKTLAQGRSALDIAAARELARTAGANYAVYGVYNRLGDAFTIETRMVPAASEDTARQHSVQGRNTELSAAVGTLVDQMTASASSARPRSVPAVAGAGGADAIADIQIRGMKVLDPDVILMRLRLRKGDTPTALTIDEDVKRIWDMGYFSDVQAALEPQAGGRALIFTVVEKPRIDNIIVEGAGKINKDDILGAMSTKTGSVLNEKLLAEDLQKVTDLYRAEGYYLAKVNSRLDPRPTGSGAVLTLSVEEGGKLYVKQVSLQGLQGMKAGDIKDYMALKERNILSFFTGTGVLKDEYLERDATAIAAYAINHGYVDAQVSPPDVQYLPDGIYVTFTVNEGPRYRLGEITFIGDLIDTEARLFEMIGLDEHKKDAGFFSLSTMQDDAKLLTEFYGDHGYAFAEVDTKVERIEDGAVLNIAYAIQKKQIVYIRRVNLEGNQKTRDNVIMRELRLADGDSYDGAKLRRSIERLNRLRYFSQVNTELVPTGDGEEEVDLKINLKEENTGAVMAGIGYSTYYDVGLPGSIMARNLFGQG